MRYGRGFAAVVVAVVLMAPAAAVGMVGPEGGRGEAARVEASPLLESAGALLASWADRLGEALSAAWAETRGTIVPGAAPTGGDTTNTTTTETADGE
jgi:hypothetical protein